MKEIIETKVKVTEEEITKYQALDGTVFDTPENCKTYENTLAVIIFNKLMNIVISNCTDVYRKAVEDLEATDSYTIMPKNKKDIDNMNQLYLLFSGRGSDSVKFSYDDIGKLFILHKRKRKYTEEDLIDWCWFIDLSKFISDATEGLCKVS